MMEKVKITMEQAEAIKWLRELYKYTFDNFMSVCVKKDFSNLSYREFSYIECLGEISAEDLKNALVNGYEVNVKEKWEKEYKYYLDVDYTSLSKEDFGHRDGVLMIIRKMNEDFKLGLELDSNVGEAI